MLAEGRKSMLAEGRKNKLAEGRKNKLAGGRELGMELVLGMLLGRELGKRSRPGHSRGKRHCGKRGNQSGRGRVQSQFWRFLD